VLSKFVKKRIGFVNASDLDSLLDRSAGFTQYFCRAYVSHLEQGQRAESGRRFSPADCASGRRNVLGPSGGCFWDRHGSRRAFFSTSWEARPFRRATGLLLRQRLLPLRANHRIPQLLKRAPQSSGAIPNRAVITRINREVRRGLDGERRANLKHRMQTCQVKQFLHGSRRDEL